MLRFVYLIFITSPLLGLSFLFCILALDQMLFTTSIKNNEIIEYQEMETPYKDCWIFCSGYEIVNSHGEKSNLLSLNENNEKVYKLDERGDFLYSYNGFIYLYLVIPLFLYLGVVWLCYSVFPSMAIRTQEHRQGGGVYRDDYCLSKFQKFKKTVKFALFYTFPLALGSAVFLYYSHQLIEHYYFQQTVTADSLIEYQTTDKTIKPCFWFCEEKELVLYKENPFVITKQISNKAYFYEENKLFYIIPIEKTQIGLSLVVKFCLSFFFFSLMASISLIKLPQLVYYMGSTSKTT